MPLIKGDIVTQSLRRQTRKVSQQSLLDLAKISLDNNTRLRRSPFRLKGNTPSPDNDSLKNGNHINTFTRSSYSFDDEQIVPKMQYMPNTHEDIQILNLQGFITHEAISKSNNIMKHNTYSKSQEERNKSKKTKSRSSIDNTLTYSKTQKKKTSHTERRKRFTRSKGRHAVDFNYNHNEDDLSLKDIDDIDNEMSGIVIEPRSSTGATNCTSTPITFEDAVKLRELLTGSAVKPLPKEWMNQGFEACKKPNLTYGIVQKKVRAFMPLIHVL